MNLEQNKSNQCEEEKKIAAVKSHFKKRKR